MATGFRSVGSGVAGTGTSAPVPVPAGTALFDIVEVHLYVETADATITPPAGFTQKADSGTTNATTRGRLLRFWKRLTAGDSGTYSFTWTTSAVYEAVAVAYKGVITFGDPYAVISAIAQSTSNGATTQDIASVSPDYSGGILTGTGTAHSTGSNPWTPPSGTTERYDGSAHLEVWDEIVAAGATGIRTLTLSSITGNSFPKGFMGVLGTDSFVRPVGTPTSGGTGTTTTISLPTGYIADNRMILTVYCKPSTAADLTIDQGWTKIGSAVVGTGAAGVDTGPLLRLSYAKDATSASETPPTITVGSPGTNSLVWVCQIVAHGAGYTWADPIEASADWVLTIDDTNTASPVTGTTGTPANQPTAGDAILAVAGIPSNDGGTLGSASLSATGLSGGVLTHTSSSRVTTTSGNDSAAYWTSWHQFAGTSSSGITASLAAASAVNHSGGVAVYIVRQASGPEPVDLTISGTVPMVTMSMSLTGMNDSDLAVASTIPQPIMAVTLSGFNDSDLSAAGTIPQPVMAVDLAVTPTVTQLTIAGNVPQPTMVMALSGFNDSDLDVAGTIPMVTMSVSLEIADSVSVVGIIPQPVVSVVLDSGDGSGIIEAPPVETDTEVVDDSPVDQAQHEEDWHVDVAVVEPDEPLPLAYDIVSAYTSISLSGTQPVVVDPVRVRKPRLRDRILVNDVDVTFYNGIRTPTPDYSLIEPFTYGVCTLVFPQIFPLIQTLSSITWLRRGARVLVQRVDDEGNVVATDYRGRIMGWDISAPFTVSVGGLFSGPASVRFRPMPMVRRIEDVAYWLMTAFRHQKLPLVYDEDFGVNLISRGENYYLDHCLELCSLGVKRNGSQITVHYDETLMKFVAAPKDKTTIDATVYFDAGDMNPSLTQDFTAEVDEVFATAHLSDGTQILNSVWPGMQQEDPIPTFPGVLEEGDDNEDVAVLVARLALLGYLKYAEKIGGYDEDVVNAILSAREDAEQLGTADDEALDEDLWNWLWDFGATGYTDKEARILPMAQRRKVRQWDRSATGNRIAINPFYDPVYAALTVSQKLELGHVRSKNHAVRLARTGLDDGSDNWVGTLDTVMSFVRGDHTPGDPITEADLMSGRELRPGMNINAPLFQGGTLFHLSAIDISNDGDNWSLALDTRFRDTMQIDGILERNRENRTSPARAFWNARSSSSAQDTIFSHDEHFGKLGKNLDLPADEWVVYPVPAGDFGTVSHTIMETKDAKAEFAMMVFQKKVTVEWLTARVANPLNSSDEWWANESVRADFKSRGIKYAAGSEEDPCGYFPGRKSRGHSLTGRWEDEAEFAYGGDSLVFWVCVYADRTSVLKRGDQFAVQRELGT